MTYVLEQLTHADQEKIILDATGNVQAKGSLVSAIKRQDLVKKWAINRDSGHYLLRAPATIKQDTDDRNYYFYFHGWLYMCGIVGWFGSEAFVEDYAKPLGSLRSEFELDIKAALATYGVFGDGPLNEFGKPEFAITPVFKNGAK
jgi:hypothetical protein